MSLSATSYSSIDQIDPAGWNAIAPRDHMCLETNHLKALEISSLNDMHPVYLTVSENDSLLGIANYFTMNTDFSGFSNTISPITRGSLKCWFPKFMEMTMLECGLIAGMGETIVANDRDISKVLPIVVREMENCAKERDADFILIRDIPFSKFGTYYDILKKSDFEPVLGYPLATIALQGKTLEDYLQSLKKDTRVKVSKHLLKLNAPEITTEVIQDFGEYADRLIYLSNQVSQKAEEYEHEKLTSAYFRNINKYLPDSSFVIAIKRNGEIVTFALCFEGEGEIFAAYVGIDYQYNHQYDLYFNQHFLCIDEALKRGKKSLNFGITTYDFKLFIGCELQPLVYFVKHCSNPDLTPGLVKMLSESIKQPGNEHRPFKEQDITSRVQLADIEKEILCAKRVSSYGVFDKVYSYNRPSLVKIAKLYSFFPIFESAQKEYVVHDGEKVIMLGSNSYMGLGSHPAVTSAAKMAIDKYGTGCSGSPFLNGTLDIHQDLARALAQFMQKEEAILFSTGYQTNLGVISAIAGRHDVIVADDLNHASIMDAIKQSYADVVRYDHENMESLEKALQKYAERNLFIVVDAVFSMEGKIANIPEIVRLAKKYNARLMLDEAHGIGVLGPGGRGAAEHFGLLDQVDIVMGTFSKSFAGVGGFVAANGKVVDYLRYMARSHMFSASLPPSIVASVRKALDIIINEPERRAKLMENAKFMAKSLQQLGYRAEFGGTAIVPIFCGDELLTLGLFNKLFSEGVYTNPVLSPAVSKGQELLRTSYMAIHDRETLSAALKVFEKVRTPYFPVQKFDPTIAWPHSTEIAREITKSDIA